MERTPSQIVVAHPLRFVEPGLGHDAGLARLAATAAVVANVTTHRIGLEPAGVSWLGRLGRRLQARPGPSGESWPVGTLEGALQDAVVAVGFGVDLADTLRNILLAGGRVRPDVLRFVRRGAGDGGADPDAAAADAVQRMLADFREAEPSRWLEIRRQVDRAMRAPVLRHALLAHVPRDRFGARRRDHLADWRRLNRRPPSASK